MKKLVTVLFMVCLLTMGNSVFSDETNTINNATNKIEISWLKKTFSNNLTWKEMLSIVDSPEEICRRISTRLEYTTNNIENATGETVWNNRKGNCMGYATAIVDACKAKGYTARIEVYMEDGNNVAHAIAIGVRNKRLWMADNGRFQYVKSWTEITKNIKRRLQWKNTVYNDRYSVEDDEKLEIAEQ